MSKLKLSKKVTDTIMLLLKTSGKLSREERAALHGIYNSYKDEAAYYRQKYEKLVKETK